MGSPSSSTSGREATRSSSRRSCGSWSRPGYLVGEARGLPAYAAPWTTRGVPASVQAILTARIDRLEPAPSAPPAASVIGKEVAEPALRLVAGAAERDGLDPPLPIRP